MRSATFTIRKPYATVIGLLLWAFAPFANGQTYPSTGAVAIAPRNAVEKSVAETGVLVSPVAAYPSTNLPPLARQNAAGVQPSPPPVLAQQASPVDPPPMLILAPANDNMSQATRADHQFDPLQTSATAALTAGEETAEGIRIASPIRITLPDPVIGPQTISEATVPRYPATATPNLILPEPATTPLPQTNPNPNDLFLAPFASAPTEPKLIVPTEPPLDVPLDLPPFKSATTLESAPLTTAAPFFPPDSKPTDQLVPVESMTNSDMPLISLPHAPVSTPPATADETSASVANSPPAAAEKQDSVATTINTPTSAPTSTPTSTPPTPSEGEIVYEGGLGDGCEEVYDPHAYFDPSAFSPDPSYDHIPYDSVPELGIYEGKWNMCSQRPLIELGRGMYRNGVVPRSYSFLGKKNLIAPGFTLFGDFRTAVAANDNGDGDPKFVWANRLNLDFDLRLTATERIHAFWGPLDDGGRFTRAESSTDGRNDLQFIQELDDDFDTLFFEGDLGYIWGGMTDQWAPFDLPFVVGKFPLLFQNGVWINDVVEGFAFTLPAKHSRRLNWSNFDFTAFFLLDDIDSLAFLGDDGLADDNAADAYGFNLFLEAYGGYTEAGYAFLNDRTGLSRSYHNVTVGHTRRIRERLSNSVRVIVNAGQDPDDGVKTADGQIVIIENSLVSSNPTYFVPYANFFAGFGTPKNLAGQPVLQNVGINFETDALTGYPRLNDQAQDTWGGAFGFNLLGPRFSWQWILEASMVQNFGESIEGDQYAVGTRIQRSLNYAWLARFDAMYGLRENATDISGVRAELRWKF